MKNRNSSLILAALVSLIGSLALAGCADKGNEPVPPGKNINNNREAMQKMFKGVPGGSSGAQGAPAPK